MYILEIPNLIKKFGPELITFKKDNQFNSNLILLEF